MSRQKNKSRKTEASAEECCSICQEDIKEGMLIPTLCSPVSHKFCLPCVISWLSSCKNSADTGVGDDWVPCPVCRQRFAVDPFDESPAVQCLPVLAKRRHIRIFPRWKYSDDDDEEEEFSSSEASSSEQSSSSSEESTSSSEHTSSSEESPSSYVHMSPAASSSDEDSSSSSEGESSSDDRHPKRRHACPTDNTCTRRAAHPMKILSEILVYFFLSLVSY